MEPQSPISPVPTPPINPVIPSVSHSSKLLPILIVVLLLIIVSFAGLFLGMKISKPVATPIPSIVLVATLTPAPTWKTYPDSTTLGLPYSFMYPSSIVESEAQDLVYLKSGGSILYFRFIPKNTDLNGIINNYQPFGTPKPFLFSNKTAVSYGELSGYKVTANAGADTYLFLGKSSFNGIFVFNYSTSDITSQNLFSQIIPTIKLTSILNTTNWKTYTNATVGYQLKTPANMSQLTKGLSGDYQWVITDPSKDTLDKDHQSIAPSGISQLEIEVSKDSVQGTYNLNCTGNALTFNQINPITTKTSLVGEVDQYIQSSATSAHSTTPNILYWSSRVCFIKNNVSYVINYQNDRNGDVDSTFDQILSTFKFTN